MESLEIADLCLIRAWNVPYVVNKCPHDAFSWPVSVYAWLGNALSQVNRYLRPWCAMISLFLEKKYEGAALMQVAQVLLPGLLVIASGQEYAAGVRRKALSIAHSLAYSLSSKQTPTDKDTSHGLATLLEAWLAPICAILREPISGQVGIASLHQPPG